MTHDPDIETLVNAFEAISASSQPPRAPLTELEAMDAAAIVRRYAAAIRDGIPKTQNADLRDMLESAAVERDRLADKIETLWKIGGH